MKGLWRYADFHLAVRPAALESTAALAGIVVERQMQPVLAGCAERDGRGGLACKWNAWAAAGKPFHFGTGIGKRHCAGAAKLAPAQGYRRPYISWRGAGGRCELRVILNQTVIFSGTPAFAVRSTIMPAGPCVEGPFS